MEAVKVPSGKKPGFFSSLFKGSPKEFSAKDKYKHLSRHARLLEESKDKIKGYLKEAAESHGISSSLAATKENAEKLVKSLRMPTPGADSAEFDKWESWSAGIFEQIESGADDLLASIEHWQEQMSSIKDKCKVTSIKLAGSDLHGKGLGAAFIEFTKKKGAGTIFQGQSKVKVVLKPEDRSIEKALFGSHDGGFANWVNEFADLREDGIGTLNMETHDVHGSIIEFVNGVQAQNFGKKNSNAHTGRMTEAIVFSFLAGLTDLHKENIIWGGKDKKTPYMIDADNALNMQAMSTPSVQSGFAFYNRTETQTEVDSINNDPQNSRSKLLKKIYEEPDAFFDALKDAFSGKTGRIVPRATTYWGQYLNTYKSMEDRYKEDLIADPPKSLVNKSGNSPGLKGECGESPSGGNYDQDEETDQIRIDFERGQIPFYAYDYSTGWVSHNGRRIWRGRSIDDAINDIRNKLGL